MLMSDDDTFVIPKLSYNQLIPPFKRDDKTTIESLKIMDSVKEMAGWSHLLAIAVLRWKLHGSASTMHAGWTSKRCMWLSLQADYWWNKWQQHNESDVHYSSHNFLSINTHLFDAAIKQLVADGLKLSNLIGIDVDGASAMVGVNHLFSTWLR